MISESDLGRLPLHDAELLGLDVEFAEAGLAEIRLRLKINPEETWIRSSGAGMTKGIVILSFINCWQVESSLRCHTSQREQLLDWAEELESEKEKAMNRLGLAVGMSLISYRFEFSGGSALLILSERCAVVGPD